mmetsp:Transcript_25341/g.40877  ORF Transcript_25341/g.40877 Transcript_25341/m.40877 type:complete len:161 (-) Transcript_25341:125-607(-)|eukprot:jgi/Bigna1/79617/fgenesh1_pg.63_\
MTIPSEAYFEFLAVLIPAALGSIAMIYSTIHSIFIMNKPRYALKDFKHPYKPWTDEQSDNKTYRGFRANMNQVEWLVYSIPIYTFSVLFSPAYPVVGSIAPWMCFVLALIYGQANVNYLKGYMKSTEDRMPGFKLRTHIFKAMLGVCIGGIICTGCRLLM